MRARGCARCRRSPGGRYFGAKLMAMAPSAPSPGAEYVIVLWDRETSRIAAFVDGPNARFGVGAGAVDPAIAAIAALEDQLCHRLTMPAYRRPGRWKATWPRGRQNSGVQDVYDRIMALMAA